ncbi:hypothetical protein T484DRAFT_1800436 [Baffinella frigidus]|nr:hypothetical protein T484DRAFT_1800436 [Cryptophyta sp. CCMP2293]
MDSNSTSYRRTWRCGMDLDAVKKDLTEAKAKAEAGMLQAELAEAKAKTESGMLQSVKKDPAEAKSKAESGMLKALKAKDAALAGQKELADGKAKAEAATAQEELAGVHEKLRQAERVRGQVEEMAAKDLDALRKLLRDTEREHAAATAANAQAEVSTKAEVSALKEEIKKVREERAKAEGRMVELGKGETLLENLRRDYAAVQNRHEVLTASLVTSEGEVGAERGRRGGVENELAAVRKASLEELSKVRGELEKMVKSGEIDHQKELAGVKAKGAEEVKVVEVALAGVRATLARAEAELAVGRDELAAVQKANTEERDAGRKSSREELAEVKKELAGVHAKWDAGRTSSKEERAKDLAASKAELAGVLEKQDKELSARRDEREKNLAAFKVELAGVEKARRLELAAVLEKQEGELAARMKELAGVQKAHTEERATELTARRSELAGVQKANKEELAAVQKANKEELAGVHEKLRQAERVRGQVEEMVKSGALDALRFELGEARRKAEEGLVGVQGMVRGREEEMGRRIAALKVEHGEEMAGCKEELAGVQEKNKEELAGVWEKNKEELAGVQEKLRAGKAKRKEDLVKALAREGVPKEALAKAEKEGVDLRAQLSLTLAQLAKAEGSLEEVRGMQKAGEKSLEKLVKERDGGLAGLAKVQVMRDADLATTQGRIAELEKLLAAAREEGKGEKAAAKLTLAGEVAASAHAAQEGARALAKMEQAAAAAGGKCEQALANIDALAVQHAQALGQLQRHVEFLEALSKDEKHGKLKAEEGLREANGLLKAALEKGVVERGAGEKAAADTAVAAATAKAAELAKVRDSSAAELAKVKESSAVELAKGKGALGKAEKEGADLGAKLAKAEGSLEEVRAQLKGAREMFDQELVKLEKRLSEEKSARSGSEKEGVKAAGQRDASLQAVEDLKKQIVRGEEAAKRGLAEQAGRLEAFLAAQTDAVAAAGKELKEAKARAVEGMKVVEVGLAGAQGEVKRVEGERDELRRSGVEAGVRAKDAEREKDKLVKLKEEAVAEVAGLRGRVEELLRQEEFLKVASRTQESFLEGLSKDERQATLKAEEALREFKDTSTKHEKDATLQAEEALRVVNAASAAELATVKESNAAELATFKDSSAAALATVRESSASDLATIRESSASDLATVKEALSAESNTIARLQGELEGATKALDAAHGSLKEQRVASEAGRVTGAQALGAAEKAGAKAASEDLKKQILKLEGEVTRLKMFVADEILKLEGEVTRLKMFVADEVKKAVTAAS